jgi:hypothetical protein
MSKPSLHPLIRRALFALARPLVRLAADHQLSLADLKRIAEIGYYAELRRRGLTVRESCDLLDISPSKAALIAQSLRSFVVPGALDPEKIDEDTLAALLWHEPLSLAKLCQILPGTRYSTLRALLDSLLDAKRIAAENRTDAVYRIVLDPANHPEDRWIERLEQLAQQLDEAADPLFTHVQAVPKQDV